jgi:uroporphyrinogen-III synthase
MPDPVVITRPLAQAAALAQRVRAAGFETVVLPLLEIAPIDDPAPLRAALAHLSDYALVAFVSPNAIEAAFVHLAAWPDEVPVAVVGEGSRLALLERGVKAPIHSPPDPAHSDSEHLLASLDLGALRGRRVLIVRGQSGRELLADELRAAGALVETVAAYRRAVPALTDDLARRLLAMIETPHHWLITSSEALRGLVELVRAAGGAAAVVKLQQQHLVVPHHRIAGSAAALGFSHLTQSGSGDERLLAALQSHA